MLRQKFAVAVIFLASSALCVAADSHVIPTTTFVAETSNNTSAANAFRAQSNGNGGVGNVSKVNVHSLLYPGATTKVYAHLVLWFGGANHMNVGYSSADKAQVARQVHDMVERGIDGVIIDWYGPGNSIDEATKMVMVEAESHPGFTFAVMVDKGAIQWNSCSGCTPQQALIQQLKYVEQTYFGSPAYMRSAGLPVVSNFDIDLSYTIDWPAVRAALQSSPTFLFQNANGFTHPLAGGSYSWVIPSTADLGMQYLDNFYATGLFFPDQQAVGAAYKGFNDTLAAWGAGRVMSQGCGQTWLQTFSTINAFHNSSKPLPAMQLVTWNDYEEGTEIESGIENCVSVNAIEAAGTLQWTIQGDESTVDHYTLFVSNDGQNLMPLGDVASGNHSVGLCEYSLAPGAVHTLYVQAVGKPSLRNHMSEPMTYVPQCTKALRPRPTRNNPPSSPQLSEHPQVIGKRAVDGFQQ